MKPDKSNSEPDHEDENDGDEKEVYEPIAGGSKVWYKRNSRDDDIKIEESVNLLNSDYNRSKSTSSKTLRSVSFPESPVTGTIETSVLLKRTRLAMKNKKPAIESFVSHQDKVSRGAIVPGSFKTIRSSLKPSQQQPLLDSRILELDEGELNVTSSWRLSRLYNRNRTQIQYLATFLVFIILVVICYAYWSYKDRSPRSENFMLTDDDDDGPPKSHGLIYG